MTKTTVWDNPDNIDKLRKLHAEGHSFSYIADAIGGITRNAAIGKAQRMGLGNHNARKDVQTFKTPKLRSPAGRPSMHAGNSQRIITRPLPPSPPREPTVPVDHRPLPGAKLLALIDLADDRSECRYPHDTAKGTRFCGCATVPGTSWCPSHLQICAAGVKFVPYANCTPAIKLLTPDAEEFLKETA